MEANISQWKSYRRAFVIGVPELVRLSELLAFADEVKLTVRLSDGTSQSDVSIDAFGNYLNTTARQIEMIEMRARNQEHSTSIELRKLSGFGDSVRVYASGPESRVLWITSQIEGWVDSITPWYSRLALMDFVMFMLTSIMCAYGLLVLYVVILVLRGGLDTTYPDSPDTGRTLLFQMLAQWLWLVAVIIGAGLNLIRAHMFPSTVFNVGAGAYALRKADFLQKTVGVALIVSIVASLIVAWIT